MSAPVRAAAAASAVLVGAFVGVLLIVPPGPALTALVDVVMTVVPAGAAVVVAGVARARVGRERAAWLLVSAGLLAWASGQVVWTWHELVLGREVPFPSWADAGYLAAVPFLGAGFIVLQRATARDESTARVLLDGAIIAGSLLFISWSYVLKPIATSGGTPFERVIAIAYPIGDVVLATVAFVAASRSAGSMRATLVLLGAGTLALAVADSGFALLALQDEYGTGNLIDAGWLAGFLLIALAALVSAPGEAVTRASTELERALLALPYVPFAIGTFVAVHVQYRDGALDTFLFPLAVVNVSTMAVRTLHALLDNERLAESLRRANADLRRSEEMRRRIVQTLAHDIMNPLSPARVHVHLLRRDATRRTSEAASLDAIDRSLLQVERLVRDLSDVARIESGGLTLHPRPIDVGVLVQDVADAFRPVLEPHGIALAVRVDPAARAVADSDRMHQVLLNLLSNARRFTPDGGTVTMDVRAVGGEVVVSVEDSGRGLLPGEIERLFQPFSQVHAAGESREKGSGLGLYISRTIVEAHGGRMWAASVGRGRGATFALAIPAA